MGFIGFPEFIRFADDQVDPVNHVRYCFFEMEHDPPEKCPKCGEKSPHRHGPRSHRYRDLPILDDRVVLEVRVERFRCRGKKCKKVIVPGIPGLEPHWSMTSRCREWIRANCLRFTAQHIAEHIGCDERTVRTLTNDRINELNSKYQPRMPEWLGIDEVSPSGRIDDSVLVFVDVEKRKPIDMGEDRKGETLKQWLKEVGKGDQPRGVTMDMCDYYRDAVREVCPEATVVADRFHIERIANKAIDRVRIDFGKKLPDAEKKSEVWKQNSRILRMHRFNIPQEGDSKNEVERKEKRLKSKLHNYNNRNDFFKWLDLYPKIKSAFLLKEHFCQIYLYHEQRETAERALELWEACVPADLASAFKSVRNIVAKDQWREEFLAYVEARKTNGYTEGFNSVVKRINRLGNGYRLRVLRARVLFGTEEPRPFVRLKPVPPKPVELQPEPPCKICPGCARDLNDSSLPQPVHEGVLLPENTYCPVCRIPVEAMLADPFPDNKCDKCCVYNDLDDLSTYEPILGKQFKLCPHCYGECDSLKKNLCDPSTTLSAGGQSLAESEFHPSGAGKPGCELFQAPANPEYASGSTPAPRTSTRAKDLNEGFSDQTAEKEEQMDFELLWSAS